MKTARMWAYDTGHVLIGGATRSLLVSLCLLAAITACQIKFASVQTGPDSCALAHRSTISVAGSQSVQLCI